MHGVHRAGWQGRLAPLALWRCDTPCFLCFADHPIAVSVCCFTPSCAKVIALAQSAGPSGVEQALSAAQELVADLQRQLAEADSVRRGLEKELSRARKQLSDEQSERNTLEEHMITRLEDMGDDVAQVGAHAAHVVWFTPCPAACCAWYD